MITVLINHLPKHIYISSLCYLDITYLNSLSLAHNLIFLVSCIIKPKEIHIIIPKMCKYITLHSKRNFVGVIKLRILRCRDYLYKFNVGKKAFNKRETKGQKMEAWVNESE